MKNLFSILLVMAIAIGSQAQTFTTSSSGGFDIESGVHTNESITIDDQVFEIFNTKSGSQYIKCISPRTGNGYAVWIGEATEHRFEGRTVYQSKKGSYCVYKISAKSGNPYPVWLTVIDD